MLNHDLLSVLAGTIVGFVLGLVGGGGSILAVPLLLYGVGVSSAHQAIGTSAVAVALSAFATMLGQLKSGLIKWPCALVFSASGIVASHFGAQLALTIPSHNLMIYFGILMMIVGILMLIRKNVEGDPDVKLNLATAKRMAPWLIGSGLFVGSLAGFFGIGGGFLIVPAMMFATGMPITNAIATSLVAITVFGLSTAASYASAGEVDWRIAAFFVGGGVIGSWIGRAAGTQMAEHKSKLNAGFGTLVICVGAYVMWQSLR